MVNGQVMKMMITSVMLLANTSSAITILLYVFTVHVYSKGFCKESDLSCYQHCRLEMHAALVWSPDPLTATRRRGR